MRFSRLISELHRRSVWQVLGSYAVVAWIILQLAETLGGLIGLPLWFGPAVVVVVLLGFPVLLITTLTQGGLRRKDFTGSGYLDSAGGSDPSLSSWRHLEGNPLRRVLNSVFTWRNAVLGGLVMAALLAVGSAGYSGLRSAGVGPLGSLVAKGVFDSNESLILSDFEDRTSDGTLGETVTALFRIDLSQSPTVHLLDRSELAPALVRMQRNPTDPITHDVAMDLAQREGVKAVVGGEVLPLGPGAVVAARLVVASSGETLVAGRETARTIDAVPEAVDRLSAQLRERIGESLRSIQGDPPLEEVTTASLDALRKYVQAEWALDMGDVPTAEGLIHETIALDSTFSMAYRKLGVILSNEGRDEEQAKEAFVRAYEGRDRLTDRERLLTDAAYHTYVTEALDSAILAYEGILASFPNDGIASNNLAVLYGENDQLDKAADLYVEAIERGRAPAVSYTNAAFTLFRIGEADSASAVVDHFREAYPNHPQGIQYAAALASARFRFEEAERLAEELLVSQEGNPRWQMWAEAELGHYAMIQGRLNEGFERLIDALDRQDGLDVKVIDLPKTVLEAVGMGSVQLHFLQDPEGAVYTVNGLLADVEYDGAEPQARGYLDVAVLFAQAGRPDLARQQMAAFRTEVPAELQEEEGWQAEMLFADGVIATVSGNPEGGLELFRRGRALVPDCELCGLLEMGEAFEASSMPDSAAAAYESYLGAKALFRAQNDNVKLHRAHLGLARSYEALGQPTRALEIYRRQLELWADADPGLQYRVQELRSKVQELRTRVQNLQTAAPDL